MKKAKLILGTLTVLTIVGGALAFKAQKAFHGNLRCTEFPNIPCPVSTYTTQDGANWSYCTELDAPADAPCFYTKVKFDQ